MTNQYLSISEAAKRANVSEITIRRKLKSNEIAYSKSSQGQYMVEKVSLGRVYRKIDFDEEVTSQDSDIQRLTDHMKTLGEQLSSITLQFREGQKQLIAGVEERARLEVELKEELCSQRLTHQREIMGKMKWIWVLSLMLVVCGILAVLGYIVF